MSRVPPEFAALAGTRAWPGGAEGLEILLRYAEELAREAETLDLTAARGLDGVLRVVVGPALAVGLAWGGGRSPPALAVDLGSGNGFPGVAAAAAWPSVSVLLVERRRRRAEAVGRCLRAAGLARVQVACLDGRDLLRHRPELEGAVDLVTARGVGRLAAVVRVAAPWLAPGGRLVHWKAYDLADRERSAGVRAALALGLEPVPELAFGPEPPGPGRLVIHERPLRGPGGPA